MKKLVLTGIAAATLMVGAGLTQPAHAQGYCWSGPLGLLHGCNYAAPAYAAPVYPYNYAPPAYPYYPPPYYYSPYERW